MALYDIIHVDDDPDEIELTGKYAEAGGLTYLAFSSLHALEEGLTSSSARVFVVDGRFPREEGGPVVGLASEAVKLIRSCYADANIILYSLEENIAEIAQENGVNSISKKDTTARELVAKLKEMLVE